MSSLQDKGLGPHNVGMFHRIIDRSNVLGATINKWPIKDAMSCVTRLSSLLHPQARILSYIQFYSQDTLDNYHRVEPAAKPEANLLSSEKHEYTLPCPARNTQCYFENLVQQTKTWVDDVFHHRLPVLNQKFCLRLLRQNRMKYLLECLAACDESMITNFRRTSESQLEACGVRNAVERKKLLQTIQDLDLSINAGHKVKCDRVSGDEDQIDDINIHVVGASYTRLRNRSSCTKKLPEDSTTKNQILLFIMKQEENDELGGKLVFGCSCCM